MVAEVKQKCKDEEDQIARLKAQLANQEVSTKSQEEELSKAQAELRQLQNEEKKLAQEIETGRGQLDFVIQQITAAQTEMTQVRARLADLHTTQRTITAALAQYSALSGGSAGQPDLTKGLVDEPLSTRATAGSSSVGALTTFSDGSMVEKEADRAADFKDDPFKTATEPFGGTDPFTSDPFNKGDSGFSDPFASDPFKSDPFKSDDPFSTTQTTTPLSSMSAKPTVSPATSAGDFSGFDPFTTQPFTSQDKASDPFSMFASPPVTASTSTDGKPPKLPPKRIVGSKASQAAADMFNSAFTAQTSIQSSGFGTDPFGATADFGSGSGFAEFGVFPSSGTSSQVSSI